MHPEPARHPFFEDQVPPAPGTEDQIKEFLNGLFLAAFEGKYRGDWDALIAHLERWEDVAIDSQFRTMTLPEGHIPRATLGKPLDPAKVALVTTGLTREGGPSASPSARQAA